MKVSFILAIVLALACTAYSADLLRAGGRTPADVNDPHVQHAAHLALGELNKEFAAKGQNIVLTLKQVVKAEMQIVAGVKYFLTLDTEGNHNRITRYEIEMWMDPSQTCHLVGHEEVALTPPDATNVLANNNAAGPFQ
eukprot:GFYU01008349.1.p1 GENE.GFYU01008349.1~~GFYU01008349.1.p1  ORF type:complete len:154 (+),score=47.75 GFYU01008349.1:51-464(+)